MGVSGSGVSVGGTGVSVGVTGVSVGVSVGGTGDEVNAGVTVGISVNVGARVGMFVGVNVFVGDNMITNVGSRGSGEGVGWKIVPATEMGGEASGNGKGVNTRITDPPVDGMAKVGVAWATAVGGAAILPGSIVNNAATVLMLGTVFSSVLRS